VVDADIARVSSPIGVFLRVAAPTAAATLIIGAMVVLLPRPATALPEFATKTGLPCGKCHVSKTGGGPRTAFGKAFEANGFEVPKKKK